MFRTQWFVKDEEGVYREVALSETGEIVNHNARRALWRMLDGFAAGMDYTDDHRLLWLLAHNPDKRLDGNYRMARADADALLWLAELAGGWYRADGEFVPLSEMRE